MNNSVVQDNLDEFSTVGGATGEHLPLTPAEAVIEAPMIMPNAATPSYQPYPWSLANSLLDFVDLKTHGRAGWLQRIVSYLFFGGLAAVVNLLVFYIAFYHGFTALSIGPVLRNTLSYIVAAELSIMANFIPNDRFTFKALPGSQRPWLQRCLRFHATCIVGSILTFLLELSLSTLTHTPPVLAEAVATMVVLVYNFSFHHIFTYRHVKSAPQH